MYMLERFLCKYKYFMFKRNYQLTCEMLMFETLPVLQERETDLKKKEFKENNIDVTKKYEYIAEHVSSIAIFWDER